MALILIFLLLLGIPAFAETDIPVKIKAERLKYYEDSASLEASGSVEVNFKEVTIYADRIRMDSATNIATAEGHVRLFSPSYSASADGLFFDADRELPVFSGFRSQLKTQKMSGMLYLTAKKLADRKQRMEGEDGSLTTCDSASPHFFMLAESLTYIPDDKIEGWNVVLYEGDIPVMWFPYLTYDLRRKRRKNWTFGHNQVEGDYLKTAWDYPGGIFLLDYMQYKGIGTGVSTDFISALGVGTLYLYSLDEKDSGIRDRIEKLSLQSDITPHTKLTLNHGYVTTYLLPGGRMDQTSLSFNLNFAEQYKRGLRFSALDNRISQTESYSLGYSQSSARASTDYYYNYDFGKTGTKWMRQNQRFSTRFPLSATTMFSTTTSYYNNTNQEGDSGDERADPAVEITGTEKGYRWALRENWVMDLRQDLSPSEPRYEFMEKLPELEISPNPTDLKFAVLSTSFGYGQYREVKYVQALGKKRDYRAERYKARLDLNKNIPLGFGTALTLGAALNQFAYSSGDQLYAYSETGGLSTNLWSFFRNELSYKKGTSDGNSPFLFDTLGNRYHEGRERMTFYYLNNFNWTFDTGFNWQTNKWFDLMTNMLIAPDKSLRFNFNTGWDIENRLYKDLVASSKWVPDDAFSADFSLRHDLNIGELRSASVLYDFFLLKGDPNQMHFRLSQVYDPVSRELKLRDIMLVKDLHCWEMRFTYSDYQKNFSVVFGLKAIPQEPVGYSSGRGFYFDGFERELQQLKPEGSVVRY